MRTPAPASSAGDTTRSHTLDTHTLEARRTLTATTRTTRRPAIEMRVLARELPGALLVLLGALVVQRSRLRHPVVRKSEYSMASRAPCRVSCAHVCS